MSFLLICPQIIVWQAKELCSTSSEPQMRLSNKKELLLDMDNRKEAGEKCSYFLQIKAYLINF